MNSMDKSGEISEECSEKWCSCWQLAAKWNAGRSPRHYRNRHVKSRQHTTCNLQ